MRGQDYSPDKLLRFRYRERFHMTEEELENEPIDVFHYNMAIIAKENEIKSEMQRNMDNAQKRSQ